MDARTRIARARFLRLLIDTPPARNRAGVPVRPWPVEFRNLIDQDVEHDEARRRLATLLAEIDIPWRWALNHMSWAWYWWTVAVYRPTEHYFVGRSIRMRWEYGRDIVAIHEEAASTDPSLRVEVETVLAIRRSGIGQLARLLEADLAPGVGVARAAAILDVLTLPAVYGEFIDVQGWTPDEFEVWLTTTLKEQLVRR